MSNCKLPAARIIGESNSRSVFQLKKRRGLTNYRLQQLEARVDKHNNLVERMTASEIRIRNIEEAVKEGQR